MTRDDTIKLALDNNFYRDGENRQMPLWVWTDDELARFAALVAAAEREACAKLCEYEWGTLAEKEAGYMFAAAIRARGNT